MVGKGGYGREAAGADKLWYYKDATGKIGLVHVDDTKQVTETVEQSPDNLWELWWGGDIVSVPANVEHRMFGNQPVFSMSQLHWQMEHDGQDPAQLANLPLASNYQGKSVNNFADLIYTIDPYFNATNASAFDAIADWEEGMSDMDLYLSEEEKVKRFMEGNPNALSAKVKEEYNRAITVFPKTTAYNQDEKTYLKYSRNDDGTISKPVKTPAAAAYVSRFLQNPGYWTIYGEGGRILSAAEKSKIDIAGAKLTAQHTDKHWDEAAFDGVAEQTIRVTDPNNADRTIEEKQTRQLTFVLTGLADEDMNDYNEAMGAEYYSNYLANPNSNDGKQDYINYVSFDNPELANRIKDMETNGSELDYESFGVKFTARKTVNGGYDLNATYTDQDGNLEEMPTDRIQTLGQLASKIRTISLYQEAKEKFDNQVIDEEAWKKFISGWGTGVLR